LTTADFVHTGPALWLEGIAKVLAAGLCVGKTQSGTGGAIRIMSEEFTLYRGASGAPTSWAFAAPIRGTQLSIGWVEGTVFAVFYHGWKYDGTGNALSNRRKMRALRQK